MSDTVSVEAFGSLNERYLNEMNRRLELEAELERLREAGQAVVDAHADDSRQQGSGRELASAVADLEELLTKGEA